ncbi:MAG: outer membrane lipoprotein chaperone LolA [Magnetococcales bacterium]|nr:outer membrane lipoprotein chaperone LolA [Magnetococcales bacterium]
MPYHPPVKYRAYLGHGLFWLLCCLPLWGWTAEQVSLPDAVKRLQNFLLTVKTLEADFVQRIEQPESGLPAESRGHISTAKPGRFRWDYQTPNQQTIVSDGQTIWFYEPDLAQVTVGKAKRLDNTPAVLLSSDLPLHTVFSWRTTEDPQLHLPVVHLLPKKEGSIKEIELVLDPHRDELLKLTTRDSLGHVSHFTFEHMRINQPIGSSRFQFEIPAHVDVIEEQSQSSDAP